MQLDWDNQIGGKATIWHPKRRPNAVATTREQKAVADCMVTFFGFGSHLRLDSSPPQWPAAARKHVDALLWKQRSQTGSRSRRATDQPDRQRSPKKKLKIKEMLGAIKDKKKRKKDGHGK